MTGLLLLAALLPLLCPSWIGAVISAAAAIYGANEAKDAQGRSNDRFAQALALVRDLYPRQRELFQRQEGYLQQALEAIREGSRQEVQAISAVGQEAVTRIRDAQRRSTASGYQGLASRGYYGSSVSSAVGRGAAYDSQRAIGALYEQLALQRAGAIGRGTAGEAAGLGALANFQGYKAAAEQELTYQEAGLLIGRQEPFDSSIYEQLGAAGAAIDSWLGQSPWAQKYLGYSKPSSPSSSSLEEQP